MKNRITLKQLIEPLRMQQEIEIRDKDNYRLFDCPSNSQALEPYFNRKVVDWLVYDRKVIISIGKEQ